MTKNTIPVDIYPLLSLKKIKIAGKLKFCLEVLGKKIAKYAMKE